MSRSKNIGQALREARDVHAPERHEALGRKRLSKRDWQDVRRACNLGASGELYATEIHGVKLFFRWQGPHSSPVETSGGQTSKPTGKPTQRRAAKARSEATRTSKKPNSRQRRSAQRLLEFMRSKGSHEGTVAAPATAGSPPQASTNRPEPGLRTPVATAPEQRKPRAVEDDGPKAADHAAVLYTAWKQDALAGSPAKSTEMETNEGSPKRAREPSRARRTPEAGGSQSSRASSRSTGHSSSPMSSGGRSDQFQRASAGALLPIPRQQRDRPRKGNGRGGSSKGGKGRGRRR